MTAIAAAPRYKSLVTSGVDEKNVSVSGILSTPTVDADGDSVNPAGGEFSRHRANPVVCLNHNIKGLPIGRAEDPDGRYSVKAVDGQLVGTCYFSQSNATAMEVFGLYADGTLRGWSINFLPRKAKAMPTPPAGRKQGWRIDEWELLEFSAVTIPNNPDTVAQRIAKGFSPGVDASLRAMLMRHATPAKAWANGWSPVGKGWTPAGRGWVPTGATK